MSPPNEPSENTEHGPTADAPQYGDDPQAQELRDRINTLSGAGRKLPELFAHLQKDLRKIARRQRFFLHASETLSTTALINEAYLKLQQSTLSQYENDQHFFAVVTRAMRFVITDYARAQLAQKRGGQIDVEPLDDRQIDELHFSDPAWQIELNDAVSRLEQLHPRTAQVVQLRYYGGLNGQEIGALLGIDESTVRRDWLKARGWLFQQLRGERL